MKIPDKTIRLKKTVCRVNILHKKDYNNHKLQWYYFPLLNSNYGDSYENNTSCHKINK